jgi:putative transposase
VADGPTTNRSKGPATSRRLLTTEPRIQKQIIGILKEQEAGVPVAELCRKHGMSDATLYNWKSKYGGLEVSEAKRLRSLEAENA